MPTLSPARPTVNAMPNPNAIEDPLDVRGGSQLLPSEENAAAALRTVCDMVAPVWPLADFVAVNPYRGVADKLYAEAQAYLKSFSDCGLTMPLAFYREAFRAGRFGRPEIEAAIDELVDGGIAGAETLCGQKLMQTLQAVEATDEPSPAVASVSRVRSIAAQHDLQTGSRWFEAIREEVGKQCAAYYDRGQAFWPNPWRGRPLYDAWRGAMRHDRRLELLGLKGLRRLVASLPAQPAEAVALLLERAGAPGSLWTKYLLCLAYETPGWSAWTQHQSRWVDGEDPRVDDGAGEDLTTLLAIRLAYDVVLLESLQATPDWSAAEAAAEADIAADDLTRCAVHRAFESGYHNGLLAELRSAAVQDAAPDAEEPPRPLAQMVFCIDVRSERVRRRLEAADGRLQTLGFAGFFGLPIRLRNLGQKSAVSQLPVLVAPKWDVQETLRGAPPAEAERAASVRTRRRLLRKAWKSFQTSAASTYACVEATGMLFGLKLIGRITGLTPAGSDPRLDGVRRGERGRLGPAPDSLLDAGATPDAQADAAASILRGMGLTQGFAKLVVFCGHACQTENNPLEAGLNCGACGGHSGEPNARLAAMLLNQPRVRGMLPARGIEVPDDVHFLAALHNTTTDQITFFDADLAPESHAADIQTLRQIVGVAGERTRAERLPLLDAASAKAPFRRARDWSEVRPEWGLTGNAAFIAGPRALTERVDLRGRVFLHNYDHRSDPERGVLELILTAPLVVASWINLQYLASTVDQRSFGSGSKTIHNVVGRFGVFSGNGGDLTTGLPWESIHDGQRYRHDPVRLLSVIAAPRDAISDVLSRHKHVSDLAVNGWIHLVAYDAGEFYRYTPRGVWAQIDDPR